MRHLQGGRLRINQIDEKGKSARAVFRARPVEWRSAVWAFGQENILAMLGEHNKNKKGLEHASTADVAGEAVATDDDTKTRKVKRTIGRDCLA